MATSAALHWAPPPPGAIKINVHGHYSHFPLRNGNSTGMGAIQRDSEGEMKLLTVGVIPELTQLGNQLWAMYAPLRRAAVQGISDIRLETDNYQAYMTIKHLRDGVAASVFDVTDQLDTLIRDESRKCVVSYVVPSRNRVARFLAKLGMETCKQLYSFDRPVGGVEELLDWDQGMGIQHPDFMDIMVPFEAPDPVDFNVSIPLAEQVSDLGLGQINAPRVARMELDIDEMNDVIDGAVEDSFIASFGPKGPLWAHEPPLGEMD
ncbi:hypothetical protein ACET3Z_007281 [Daucus carota]